MHFLFIAITRKYAFPLRPLAKQKTVSFPTFIPKQIWDAAEHFQRSNSDDSHCKFQIFTDLNKASSFKFIRNKRKGKWMLYILQIKNSFC